MSRERQGLRRQFLGFLWILLVAIVTVGLGILHVARSREELALRRGIWNEVRKFRALDDERAQVRRQITEMLAIPRTAVKAEVMGLRPVGRDQVLNLVGPEE